MSSFDELLRAQGIANGAANNSLLLASAVTQPNDEADYVYSDTYKKFDFFIDEDYASLTTDRTVVIGGTQVNITQEENSQVIPFQIRRYWEGVDLADKNFIIYFVNANGEEGFGVPVNFRYNDSYIRFYWLVSAYATACAGTLSFEIWAIGTISDVNNAQSTYLWKTKPNTSLTVVKSLAGSGTVQPDYSAITTIIDDLQNQIATVSTIVGEATSARDQVIVLQQEIGQDKQAIIDQVTTNVTDSLDDLVTDRMSNYATEAELEALESKWPDAQYDSETYTLRFYEGETLVHEYNIQSNPTSQWAADFSTGIKTDIRAEITAVSNALADYQTSTDSDISDLRTAVTALQETLGDGGEFWDATKIQEELDKKADVSSIGEIRTTATNAWDKAGTNETLIASLSSALSDLRTTVENIGDQEDQYKYYITYDDDPDAEEADRYYLTLWKYTDDSKAFDQDSQFIPGTDPETTVQLVKSVRIVGGGGGGGSATYGSKITLRYVTSSPVTRLLGSTIILSYYYDSVETGVEDGFEPEHYGGTATWRLNNRVIGTQEIFPQTTVDFDITPFMTNVSDGEKPKFELTVEDATKNTASKTWTIIPVDIRQESDFDDTITRPANQPIKFMYTPYGSVEKTVHFRLDRSETELESVVTSESGIPQSYMLPAQPHGVHYLETWITATIDGVAIDPTPVISKDLIWYDSTSSVPVVAITNQNVFAYQYSNVTISYVVYDPTTENPRVTISVDDVVVSTETVRNGINEWHYKVTDLGEHVVTITCSNSAGESGYSASRSVTLSVKEVKITIPTISVEPEFEFIPNGRSNASENRIWTDNKYRMSVSDNFDWTNGGYRTDENGDVYFCIKAGTTASFDYKPFGVLDSSEQDASVLKTGKEFKIIYKVANVRNASTKWIECISGTQKQGFVGYAHNINLSSSTNSLEFPLSEDDVIEFEYKINRSTGSNPTYLTIGYEDGTPLRARIYGTKDSLENFDQINPADIVIGSTDCDVWIYRIRAYESDLTDKEILTNFITDARSTDELLARYNRNKGICDSNGNLILTPKALSEACPDLRVLELTVDTFTTGKNNFVHLQKARCFYKNGDEELDNWTITDAYLSGQGTTSDRYGASGRNLDVIFANDGTHSLLVSSKADYKFEPGYASKLYLGVTDDNDLAVATPIVNGEEIDNGDGTTTVQEAKITLTRESVPNDWFNIKVNVASSENANNALLQKRYNDYLPYDTLYEQRDPYAKNSMEFVNCVVFVKESNADLSTHTEFMNDTDFHFYAIGNFGDSKKTDFTRACDPTDMNEFVVEISDNDNPNQRFYTGEVDSNNPREQLYPIDPSHWVAGNEAYDALYNDWDGSFEFRYELCGAVKDGMGDVSASDAAAQHEANKQIWRDFYTWVVTSTDEEFKAELGDWMIVNSALYWYLFTERFTMIDNRAKNSFWRYGKCPDGQYRFELLDYDNDTAIGINNQGQLAMPYGLEDTDDRPDGTDWAFNAGDSVFWRRIRKLFAAELGALYRNGNLADCWRSDNTIAEFERWQSKFPEELWRLDYERKYLRPYRDGKIDRYLNEMMNGRKRYQRRQWERDQDSYIGSKYMVNYVTDDKHSIEFRCNCPADTIASARPNYDIDVVPYSDMYVSAVYGNASGDSRTVQFRAKAGQRYTIESPLGNSSNTQINIFNAQRLQEIDNLATCYIGTNSGLGNAIRLKTLKIGLETVGYVNPYMTTLSIGDNDLLEELDIRNISNLASVSLTGCSSLRKLYADGTSLGLVAFANGGRITEAHLPSTISVLKLRNLMDLTDEGFYFTGYKNLNGLIIENCPYIDSAKMIMDSVNLERLRATELNWRIEDDIVVDRGDGSATQTLKPFEWLETLTRLYGYGASDNNINKSVLTGYAWIPTSNTYLQEKFHQAWPDFIIDPESKLTAYTVTFRNPLTDPNETILYVDHVVDGSNAEDPVATGKIAVPTMESTVSTTYTFANAWSRTGNTADADALLNIGGDRTIYAVYNENPREYTVTFVNRSGTVLQQTQARYGSTVEYDGPIPTYTLQEAANDFFLFKGWKTYPIVTGDITIEPDYAFYHYNYETLSSTPLDEMSAVQVYALLKKRAEDRLPFTIPYGSTVSFKMGVDFNYSNVESNDLIDAETTYQYSISAGYGNYTNTGVELLSEDKDWILVVDYYFNASSSAPADLFGCYQNQGGVGFRLRYESNGLKIYWGNKSQTIPSGMNVRDVIVLRHKKGDNTLYVYSGNLPNQSIAYYEMTATSSVISEEGVNYHKKLIFGAMQQDNGTSYSYYANGTIYSAKIFYTDIGDSACREMAGWNHETVTAEMCRRLAYDIDDGSGQQALMTFIAKHLLTNSMVGYSGNNQGGYFGSNGYMHNVLNNRFYNSIPIEWRQLIKPCLISANDGVLNSATSTEENASVTTRSCYITIPALIELAGVETYNVDPTSNNYERHPYTSEAGYPTQGIGYDSECINTEAERIRRYPNGEIGRYFTRTAYPRQYQSVWYIVTGEPSVSDSYVAGQITAGWYDESAGQLGCCVEFSL